MTDNCCGCRLCRYSRTVGLEIRRAKVNHQFQKVGRVLPVQTGIEVLLLFRLFQFLQQVALRFVSLSPRRRLAVGFDTFGRGVLSTSPRANVTE